jgi:MFS family permease
MAHSVQAQKIEETARLASMAKAYYVLILLTLVWAFQFANTNIINVVLEPIKKEFALSDTMMGLMVGFAFVLIGSIIMMPVARLADRKGRISIISIGVVLWSLMTTLGSFAQSAATLLLSRVGMGIGGSVVPGPGNSLASDYFPKHKLPMAMAIMSTAPCVGACLAFMVGGFIGTYWGWRSAFIFVGIPGFIVAALLFFTVKEPVRGLQDGKDADTRDYGLGETLRFFIENKTYLLMVIGFTFSGFADLALTTWLVACMMRVHNLTMLQASTVGGILSPLGGFIGVLLGGAVIGYLGRKDDKWKIVGPGITSFLAVPVLIVFLFAPLSVAWAALFCSVLLMTFRMGPLLGLSQIVVKVRMRAFATATLFVIGNLFGSGAGPLIIGALNDHLNPTYGPLAVRYSLLCVPAASLIGASCYLWAGRYVKADIGRSLVEGN